MSKKILIDMTKCRDCEDCVVSCSYEFHPNNIGIKDIRELATFRFSCRKCEDAPCIAVCPVEALERNKDGVIDRATNICIGCKSCVSACPFGTIMDDIFNYKKSICDLCEFSNETTNLECINTCPENAISLVDMEENTDENIHKLNDNILVKEYTWDKLRK